MSEFDALRLVALLGAAFLVLPGFLYAMKKLTISEKLRNLALWLGISLLIAIFYRFSGLA